MGLLHQKARRGWGHTVEFDCEVCLLGMDGKEFDTVTIFEGPRESAMLYVRIEGKEFSLRIFFVSIMLCMFTYLLGFYAPGWII